ncbi:MAG: Sir2 silent information regulator family NAD-dependent deacetylase [Ruminococcaceae bacterium]|nr:Sir2 silent information regulator family NAD-dependent deacetylase [Oscillospiraceae bacterium]
MMFRRRIPASSDTPDGINKLKRALEEADAVIIGAGAGLSTSAGFVYTGERLEEYFSDFVGKHHFEDMYSGGFYAMQWPAEELWAYWSRYIYINRYMDPSKPVYKELFELVKDKDYFVLTTNVDHCFQRAGFDKHRLFYTQGDYGLWQCSKPCHQATYDNEETVRRMVLAQGFAIGEDGALTVPEGATLKMTVPTELVPRCPVCGEPMSMNLRADDTFVEDEGWHAAAERYASFLTARETQKVLFLELGVGYNTPGIIKFPFWRMTAQNPNATYAALNFGEAVTRDNIRGRSICISGDIGDILNKLK